MRPRGRAIPDDGAEPTLAALHAAIVEDLARRRLEAFPGLPAAEAPAAVAWPGEDWRALLDLAERLQVRLVYVEAELFDDDTLQRLVGRPTGGSTTSTGDLLGEAAARLGQLARLGVGFVHGGVLHLWRHPAPWREELYDRLDELRQHGRDATVDRLADELNASPLFVAATNDLGASWWPWRSPRRSAPASPVGSTPATTTRRTKSHSRQSARPPTWSAS